MKGNIIPRHEMLLTLHKVVENLSAMIDINKLLILCNYQIFIEIHSINLKTIESSDDEEEDVYIPKEVQDWIQYTFMAQEESLLNRKTEKKSTFSIFNKDSYRLNLL